MGVCGGMDGCRQVASGNERHARYPVFALLALVNCVPVLIQGEDALGRSMAFSTDRKVGNLPRPYPQS